MVSRRRFLASLGCAGGTSVFYPYLTALGSTPPLADITNSSAKRLALAIRRKEISSVEVVELFLRQIEKINPKLNAVVQVNGDRARAEAKLADQQVHRRERLGPLQGVPVTIKDSFDTE